MLSSGRGILSWTNCLFLVTTMFYANDESSIPNTHTKCLRFLGTYPGFTGHFACFNSPGSPPPTHITRLVVSDS